MGIERPTLTLVVKRRPVRMNTRMWFVTAWILVLNVWRIVL